MTILQQHVDTKNFIKNKINSYLDYSNILFKFYFNSNNVFEKKGKYAFFFPFSFNFINIKIFSLTENKLIHEIINYQNTTYVFNYEVDDILIKIKTDKNENYSREIRIKNALNLKTSEYNFNPFIYNSNNISEVILENLSKLRNKIDIKYMLDYPDCCKKTDENCIDNDLTIYFYDLNKISLQESYLKINYFTWQDFQNKSIRNKLNKLVYSDENFKFNSQYKCVFSAFDENNNRCKLILSPINHYQFIDNLLTLIDKINKDFSISQNNYRFLFNNPTKN